MKIFYILFLFFISIYTTFAVNEIDIISREEWWANESFRYIDWPEWTEILKKRNESSEIIKEPIEKIVENTGSTSDKDSKLDKYMSIDEILITRFWKFIELDSKEYNYKWKRLAWPVSKSKRINGIVIHHTASEYESSIESVQKIYRFHALSREWWDIWYNYLIWKDWEIYEWRAGWDYVVWAHDKWNNRWNIWIAIIWNYSEKEINYSQYTTLKALTRYIIKKYDLDITSKTYFHTECLWKECNSPIKTELRYPIVWHRDAWHTSCPWDKLYEQIDKLRKDLLKDPISIANLYKKKIFKSLSRFPDEKLITILAKIESGLDLKKSSNKLKLRWLITDYFRYKNDTSLLLSNNVDKNIKIKLSYPHNDEIEIVSWWVKMKLNRRWDRVFLNWIRYNIFIVPKKDKRDILEITSWERIPSWDKQWKYNDNKFRWDLVIYSKNWKLNVVNSLNIEDYLKWLWEVSDYEDPEKVKTIITAARSYATWYTTKDKKFPWEFYDWVDDPNVFQKYLWYWLEERSPNITKYVNETQWKIITYNSKIIKPWYFSSSNWKTLSFYEYCTIRYSNTVCSIESKKYPYLQSVVDKWGDWLLKRWHGVWISWVWVSYFAERWWTYDMIIKYFLKWVNVL